MLIEQNGGLSDPTSPDPNDSSMKELMMMQMIKQLRQQLASQQQMPPGQPQMPPGPQSPPQQQPGPPQPNPAMMTNALRGQ